MTLSAAFTVEGSGNPAEHIAAYGTTIDLALVSTTGAHIITWEILACSKSGASLPTLTPAGSPTGATCTFALPADPGDGLGRTYLVKCTVSNTRDTAVEFAVVGAANVSGLLPVVPGEENYRDSTHGWSQVVNEALARGGGGGGSAVYVADLTALRAQGSLSDGLVATVGTPASTWVYSSSSGAGFADDGATVVRPTAVLLGSNGRWYPASPGAVVPTIAALRLAVSGKQSEISVQAYSSKGDGGGGHFDYDSTDTTSADNVGTIVVAGTRRYKRRFSGTRIAAAWFGCKSRISFATDALADAAGATNLAALEAATDVSNSTGPGYLELPPGGDIFIDDTWEIPLSYTDITVVGGGQGYSDQPHQNLGSFLRPSRVFPLGAAVFRLNSSRRCKPENMGIDGTSYGLVFTVNTGTDKILATAHGLVNGQRVWFDTSGTFPGGLSGRGDALAYYVINKTTDDFQVSLDFGGTAIDITSAGTGVQTCHPGRAGVGLDNTAEISFGNQANQFARISVRGVLFRTVAFTANAGTNVFTATAHGFGANRKVYLNTTGTLPTGLELGTMRSVNTVETGYQYYVINPTADTFQLSATAGGGAIDISDAGSGTHNAQGLGYAVHTGGYATGIQVSNTSYDVIHVTECDVGFYVDGSSGTTDIKFHQCLINNQNFGIVCDTGGELDLDHVNVEDAGFPRGNALLIRPTFGKVTATDCRFEEFGGVVCNMPQGARPFPTAFARCLFQFTNVKLSTFDAATNTITYARHLLHAGERVDFVHTGAGGTFLPAGLNELVFTADAGTNVITHTGLDIPTETRVQVATTGSLPTGLLPATDYWTIRQSSSTSKLASSRANAIDSIPIDITTAGSGTNTLEFLIRYYVINPTIDTFQVALTDGGAAVDFTTDGDGYNWFRANDTIVDYNQGSNLKFDQCYIYCANPGLDTGYLDLGGQSGGVGGTVLLDGTFLGNGANTRLGGNFPVAVYTIGASTPTAIDNSAYGPILGIQGGAFYMSEVSDSVSGVGVMPPRGWTSWTLSDVLKWASTTDGVVAMKLYRGGTLEIPTAITLSTRAFATVTGGVLSMTLPDGAAFAAIGSNPAASGNLRFGKVGTNSGFSITVRNNAGGGDITFMSGDTADNVSFGDAAYPSFLFGSTAKIASDVWSIGTASTPSATQVWSTPGNHTNDRSLDETGDTLVQVANVLGTLINDLKVKGIIG